MNLSSCGPAADEPRDPGLYVSLKILGEESTPTHWENEEKETCYLASSFLDLELEFSFVPPEDSEVTFQGDCVKFSGKSIDVTYFYNEEQTPLYWLSFPVIQGIIASIIPLKIMRAILISSSKTFILCQRTLLKAVTDSAGMKAPSMR